MLRSIIILLCFVVLGIEIVAQQISESKLQDFLQRWGKGQTTDPRTLPVYLATGAMELAEQNENGMRIWIGSEGVHLWQGETNQPMWELVSDQAVVWFKPAEDPNKPNNPSGNAEHSTSNAQNQNNPSGNTEHSTSNAQNKNNRSGDAEQATSNAQNKNNPSGGAADKLRADTAQLYAEGNVHFRWADHYFHGQQLYFDFVRNQGVVTKGILRTTVPTSSQTFNIQLRAEQLRIYSSKEIEADIAVISPCQFGDPHYHFQAQEVRVVKLTDKIYVTARHNHVEAFGVPFFYIPYIAGENLENWPLKSFQYGHSSKWGHYVMTTWGGDLYENKNNKIGLSKVQWLLDLDARQDRGFAGGPQLHYQGSLPENSPFSGQVRLYHSRDQPIDELGSSLKHQPDEDDEATWDNRYRIYALHRHRFPHEWFLDAEISDISDRNFLRDFFEEEFREEKEPETYAYIRKYWPHQALTLLGRWRLNDYQNQIEYMPQGTYETVYLPLFPDIFGRLYWSNRIEVSEVRRRDEDIAPTIWDNQRIFRTDLHNRLSYQFSLGPVHFLPFVASRLSYFEKDGDGESDAIRQSVELGSEAAVNFYRKFNWQSSFFQVDQVLHVITPRLRYHWICANSIDSDELIPFDEIEQYDKMQSLELVVTNRLRTVRNGQVADFLWSEVTLRYFVDRPKYSISDDYHNEGSHRFDNLQTDLLWYIRSNLWIKTRADYNFRRNDVDLFYATLGYDINDKLSVWLDQRHRHHNSSLTTGSISYTYNEKWAFQVLAQYDWREDKMRECKFKVRRFFHCFALDLVVKYDDVDNNTSFTAEFYPIDLLPKKNTF